MFEHEESDKCRFNQDCRFKLCQYKHFETSNSHEQNVEQEKADKSKQENKVEDEDEYKKYDKLSDRDQFEVQEIVCEKLCF